MNTEIIQEKGSDNSINNKNNNSKSIDNNNNNNKTDSLIAIKFQLHQPTTNNRISNEIIKTKRKLL